MPTLQNLVERFRKESGIAATLQHDCADITLPAILEMQVVRIVQESLANTRKHSQAQHVRVLIHCNEEGDFRALIEDDGIGIGDAVLDGSPGEHVGLSIMQERALRLGGKLRIESDPGEGTRIELTFHHQADEIGTTHTSIEQANGNDARTHH